MVTVATAPTMVDASSAASVERIDNEKRKGCEISSVLSKASSSSLSAPAGVLTLRNALAWVKPSLIAASCVLRRAEAERELAVACERHVHRAKRVGHRDALEDLARQLGQDRLRED